MGLGGAVLLCAGCCGWCGYPIGILKVCFALATGENLVVVMPLDSFFYLV